MPDNSARIDCDISKIMMSEIENENKFFIRKKIFADSVSFRFLDSILDVLDHPQFLDEIEKLLLNEEKTAIANQSLMDIMVGRSVSILILKLFL